MSDQDYLQKQAIQNQLNCGSVSPYLGGFYPQPELYSKKKLNVEAVEGGYIISGFFKDKGDTRTVAVSSEGLADILKGWCAQFSANA